MKHHPRTGSPTGTGGYSRQIPRHFLSRTWLDRPLPLAQRLRQAHLTIRLDVALRKVVAT